MTSVLFAFPDTSDVDGREKCKGAFLDAYQIIMHRNWPSLTSKIFLHTCRIYQCHSLEGKG